MFILTRGDDNVQIRRWETVVQRLVHNRVLRVSFLRCEYEQSADLKFADGCPKLTQRIPCGSRYVICELIYSDPDENGAIDNVLKISDEVDRSRQTPPCVKRLVGNKATCCWINFEQVYSYQISV